MKNNFLQIILQKNLSLDELIDFFIKICNKNKPEIPRLPENSNPITPEVPVWPKLPTITKPPIDEKFYQETRNLIVSDKEQESISGFAITQQQINEELKYYFIVTNEELIRLNIKLIDNIKELIINKITNLNTSPPIGNDYNRELIVDTFSVTTATVGKTLSQNINNWDFLQIDGIDQNSAKFSWFLPAITGVNRLTLMTLEKGKNYNISIWVTTVNQTLINFDKIYYYTIKPPTAVKFKIYGIKMSRIN